MVYVSEDAEPNGADCEIPHRSHINTLTPKEVWWWTPDGVPARMLTSKGGGHRVVYVNEDP